MKLNQELANVSAVEVIKNEKGSAVPYIFAWLLGVPTSILILIALVRAVF